MCKPYLNHRNFFSYDDYQLETKFDIPKSKFIFCLIQHARDAQVSKKLIKGDKSFYEYLNQCKKNGKRFCLSYLRCRDTGLKSTRKYVDF